MAKYINKDLIINDTNMTLENLANTLTEKKWYLENGKYHYEGQDCTEFKLPTEYCEIFTIMDNTKRRGVAIAMKWQEGENNYVMWINKMHDDTGECNWLGWVEVPIYLKPTLSESAFSQNTDKYTGIVQYTIDRKVCYLKVFAQCLNVSDSWVQVGTVPKPLFDNFIDFPVGTQVDTANIRATITKDGALRLHGGGQSAVDYTAFISYPIQ